MALRPPIGAHIFWSSYERVNTRYQRIGHTSALKNSRKRLDRNLSKGLSDAYADCIEHLHDRSYLVVVTAALQSLLAIRNHRCFFFVELTLTGIFKMPALTSIYTRLERTVSSHHPFTLQYIGVDFW